MEPDGVWGGIGAAVAAAVAVVWHFIRRESGEGGSVTNQLLNRIGELETSLMSERERAELLEAEVGKLRQERYELAGRITHMEGQIVQLTRLVHHFHDKDGE